MNATVLELDGSPLFMRVGEAVEIPVDTTDSGGAPDNVEVTAINLLTKADTTAALFGETPAAAVVAGNVITLPLLTAAEVGSHVVTVQYENTKWKPARPKLVIHVTE